MERTKHSFSGWIQDAGTSANQFLCDLSLRRIDADDMRDETREELMGLCECLCDVINRAREEVAAAEEDRAELRASKHREWAPAE